MFTTNSFLFQVFSQLFVSLKGASGAYSEQEEVLSNSMSNITAVGPTIVSYSLNNSLASEVKLFLYFSSKWIILSEIYFKTEKVNKPVLENREEISESEEAELFNKKQSESVRKDMPLDDSNIILQNSSRDLDRRPILHREHSDYKQTYIGIGIGILGMAVIMLVLIIYLILRKNKHQIFSKKSGKFCITSFLH